MKNIHFRNLLSIPGNLSLEKLIFEKFSEETEFGNFGFSISILFPAFLPLFPAFSP